MAGFSGRRAILAAAWLLLGVGPALAAPALEASEDRELQELIDAGVKPQTIQLNDAAIQYYRHPAGEAGAHEFLVMSRGGHMPIRLAAQRFAMRMLQLGGRGPNAIYVGYGAAAGCCNQAYLVWIERELRCETIELGGSDLAVEGRRGGARLRFQDPAFASWHAAPAQSPAPTVLLRYDPEGRGYVADGAAMRRPAPDAAALRREAEALRRSYESLPADGLDPTLWARMLDLIYSGNAAAARDLLDAAWPVERPGEGEFLTDFSKQLWRGAVWRRYDLARALDAEAAFPPIGGKPAQTGTTASHE